MLSPVTSVYQPAEAAQMVGCGTARRSMRLPTAVYGMASCAEFLLTSALVITGAFVGPKAQLCQQASAPPEVCQNPPLPTIVPIIPPAPLNSKICPSGKYRRIVAAALLMTMRILYCVSSWRRKLLSHVFTAVMTYPGGVITVVVPGQRTSPVV